MKKQRNPINFIFTAQHCNNREVKTLMSCAEPTIAKMKAAAGRCSNKI